jgi:thioredoxin reductase
MSHSTLPVAIIGAGPVGLAAAAHLVSRSLTPLVLEAGTHVGDGVRQWGHVRMFSPWSFNVDPVAANLLARQGWTMPAEDEYPTGEDLVEHYLEPLARSHELLPHIRLSTRVRAVARLQHDRMKDGRREDAPFLVRVLGPDGEQDVVARAVIDASGTLGTPGSLGASGVPAIGEAAVRAHIFYGIPDVRGKARVRYSRRRVLVVGSGHSALNALLDLAQLAEEEPGARILWAIRRQTIGQLFGGAGRDQLEERGKLGARVRALLEDGRVELSAGFRITQVVSTPKGIVARDGDRSLAPVDEIVAATGFRPDWSMLSEVRLDLDPAIESTRALAPLIDPNVHSCGTVPPHGADELKQPEADLFIVGMKSYGRAPTFLMRTGYEQARSVVSAIAGDWDAARRVELVLPETGVCSTERSGDAAGGCCVPLLHEPAEQVEAARCCDSIPASTCGDEEAKPVCCGSEAVPDICGCDVETAVIEAR